LDYLLISTVEKALPPIIKAEELFCSEKCYPLFGGVFAENYCSKPEAEYEESPYDFRNCR